MKKKTVKKTRNYSFKKSKRLPVERMIEINGIKIPSMTGTCYHAIMCTLAEYSDAFCSWSKIFDRTEKYMRQFGGDEVWTKFTGKRMSKHYQQRIKDNTHTLTRTGNNAYGYRLHEQGMVIYFFKDGAVLFTGGKLHQKGKEYNVVFPGGKKLQVRYRGNIMTWKEYNHFKDLGYIDSSGKILDHDNIKKIRAKSALLGPPAILQANTQKIKVVISLEDSYNQDTALRLEYMGLTVTSSYDNKIEGTVPADKVDQIMSDKDVLEVNLCNKKEFAMRKDAKNIAKDVVEGLKELDRKGELARAGEKVAKAINDLREERRLTSRELNRRATI